jgi:hypothetical protein
LKGLKFEMALLKEKLAKAEKAAAQVREGQVEGPGTLSLVCVAVTVTWLHKVTLSI